MPKQKIAVVQPIMIPGGGTEAVTAWTVEALKDDWDVTLITFSEIDAGTLNRYYGTQFSEDDFSIARPRRLPIVFSFHLRIFENPCRNDQGHVPFDSGFAKCVIGRWAPCI